MVWLEHEPCVVGFNITFLKDLSVNVLITITRLTGASRTARGNCVG